ncbi:MAG: methyltransferase family protein [Actinomycetota bacterium]
MEGRKTRGWLVPRLVSALAPAWKLTPLPGEHVAAIAAGWLLQRGRPLDLPRSCAPVGGVLVLAGMAVELAAVRERSDRDIDRPGHLTVTGLHGLTRNPMYLGWSLIHLGAGLALRTLWILATWPASLALLHRAVLREERELAELFGAEYLAYMARVPRYAGLRRRDPGGGGGARSSPSRHLRDPGHAARPER